HQAAEGAGTGWHLGLAALWIGIYRPGLRSDPGGWPGGGSSDARLRTRDPASGIGYRSCRPSTGQTVTGTGRADRICPADYSLRHLDSGGWWSRSSPSFSSSEYWRFAASPRGSDWERPPPSPLKRCVRQLCEGV